MLSLAVSGWLLYHPAPHIRNENPDNVNFHNFVNRCPNGQHNNGIEKQQKRSVLDVNEWQRRKDKYEERRRRRKRQKYKLKASLLTEFESDEWQFDIVSTLPLLNDDEIM